jgi:hypothetical protein
MVNRIGLPFKVGGPSSGRLQNGMAICLDYREYPAICGPTASAEPQSSGSPCAPRLADSPGSR